MAALELYRESLSKVRPAPADALMQISGDLGNSGHLVESIAVVSPCFDPRLHGLQVGNNLIKSHLDLGQLDAAKVILNQLYALKRPDWGQHLAYWDTEIAKAEVATSASVKAEDISIGMATIEGPVWLKPTSPAVELFPARDRTVRIAFLAGTIELPTNSKRVECQVADAPGRASRAIPLYLAEQIEFGTVARVQTLIPWVAKGGGFAVFQKAWSDEDAAACARKDEAKNDFVVSLHLNVVTEPWRAGVRVIRTIDAKSIGEIEVSFNVFQPGDKLQELCQTILEILMRESGIEMLAQPSSYSTPSRNDLGCYILRLEQLLAVRCGAMAVQGGGEGGLSGEREILNGNIQQCLGSPKSVSVRVLLAQTFWTMRFVRPDILPEFKLQVEMLQREHPLEEPANGVVQRILDEAFAV